MVSGIPRKHVHTNLLTISYSEKPFLSLSPAGAYPAYGSLLFTFRTCSELRTAKSGLTAVWPQTHSSSPAGFPSGLECSLREKVFSVIIDC
jgi:hypothetical protein